MRWRYNYPRHLDVRTVRRFLFIPLTVNDITRWLEYATIEQKYICSWDGGSWYNIKWVD